MRIGDFTIRRLIDSGGMGSVYEAMQDQPRRRVALKMMRAGVTSRSAHRRFEFESQLLARLQHPGIAQVFGAGTHDDGGEGIPFFAMEYIPDARSLTSYADAEKLGIRDRLILFRKVCAAVQYGHLKGIIHRDLKPGNILVDGNGRPKVIDFGIARCTDSDLAVTTQQTDVGQLLGTLQYMSPEQFRADPVDIDTRSDVYALGVVLYELLAGTPPYDVRKLALHEVARAVQEDDPAPLSSTNRLLRGDLEIIARKSLEKKRDRRYQSVASLSDDLGRYLGHEPIAARKASVLDLSIKWIRRHQMAAVVLVLLGLLVPPGLAMGWGWFATREAYRELDAANDALQEARRNEQFNLLYRIIQGSRSERALASLIDESTFPSLATRADADPEPSAVRFKLTGTIGTAGFGATQAIVADNVERILTDLASEYPSVRTIILSIDSPGGALTGRGELIEVFDGFRDRFRFVFVVERAMTAALQVALSGDEMLVVPGGVVGSATLSLGGDEVILGREFETWRNELAATLMRYRNVSEDTATALARYFVEPDRELWWQADTRTAANRPGPEPGWKRIGSGNDRVLTAEQAVEMGLAEAIGGSDGELASVLPEGIGIYSVQGMLNAQQRSHVWSSRGERLDTLLKPMIDGIYELSDPSFDGPDAVPERLARLRELSEIIRSAYEVDLTGHPEVGFCPRPLKCLLEAVDLFIERVMAAPEVDRGTVVPELAASLRRRLEACLTP